MWRAACVLVILLWFEPNLGVAQYDLGQQISQQVRNSLRGLDTLGSRISEDVERQLAPLENLGDDIRNKVEKSLMPVYAMGIRNEMAHGTGGTTIATYNGKHPRTFVIKNGVRSVCNGNIQGPQCDGTLEPFGIVNREDYCYSRSYASINDNLCLSSGAINVNVINNHISCTSADGSPTIILTRKEFNDLCGNITPGQIVYKYYADPNNPRAIPIPNPNPYVNCRNHEPGICEFDGDGVGGSNIVTSNSNIISTGGGNIIRVNSY